MNKDAKIYIAGHEGLIGCAVVRRLKAEGFSNLITKSHDELDLIRQFEVDDFFKKEKPQYVILSAAKVGGIRANISYPAQFIYENIMIQSNVIHSAYLYGAKKLLFFGSACSYPRDSEQPMKEEYLLGGYLEPTNEPYAVAKIGGIKMCQAYNQQYGTNFVCAMPTNVYGPGDNFDLEDAHVIPALIRKFHKAKLNNETSVTIWGSGNARREFIFVDDTAEAAIFLMENYNSSEIINLSTGEDITIRELVSIIKRIIGYKGEVIFDTSKPEGIPQKVLDASRLKMLGWQVKIPLAEGVKKTYEWYEKNLANINE